MGDMYGAVNGIPCIQAHTVFMMYHGETDFCGMPDICEATNKLFRMLGFTSMLETTKAKVDVMKEKLGRKGLVSSSNPPVVPMSLAELIEDINEPLCPKFNCLSALVCPPPKS